MPVSQDAVKWAFRLLLGRDITGTQDEEKLLESFCKTKDEPALVELFYKCNEFRSINKTSNYIQCLEPNDVKEQKKDGFDPKSKLKISLFGNCQLDGIGHAIEASTNNAHVLFFHIGLVNILRNLENGEFIEIIHQSDYIIVQHRGIYEKISSCYAGSEGRLRYVPAIAFNGFHPDNDYVWTKDRDRVAGILADYNSLLAAYGWNHGMSVTSTLELFRDEVFDHIGYYDCMDASCKNLIRIGREVDYPMPELLKKWLSQGFFMHSINHPKIFVLADIAYEFLRKNRIDHVPHIESYLKDRLADSVCWPVYPHIASKNKLNGSYFFKKGGQTDMPVMITLEEFVSASFENYNKYDKGSLFSPRFQEEGFQTLDEFIKKTKNKTGISKNSPYAELPSYCFWKRSLSSIETRNVDPVVIARFKIGMDEKVATAGSCFAQHIAKRLSTEGFNYYVPEVGASLAESNRKERNYGVFSCRYGNLYTTRQLVQLFDRCMGRFTPKEIAWQRADGRYVDPLRPQIEPEGFESIEVMEASRREHLTCVKEMFEKLDILVFTLGLTESWESLEDGAVFPLAPGVVGGAINPSRHRFRNLTAKEVGDDLELFLLKLQSVNPKARVILTVSPVPLIATYENRHVLVSNTHSKAVLRTVAGEIASRYEHCDYFPSYEIITGQHVGNGYLEEDLRSVRPEGVDHVMRVFLKHYAGKEGLENQESQRAREQKSAIERINDVICDEEAIDS
jgi:hypothetical protein